MTNTLISQKINTSLTYSVNLPVKKNSKTPVLILLHGYGSNESDLFDLAKTMDSKFITFSLRAPNTTREGGFCWYELEFLPNQQFKYDYKQAVLSRMKILSFISNACKAYQVDSTSVFLLGFSQGTIMSYDIALSTTNKVKGVVALSGRMMEESKLQKTNLAQLSKIKFFIAHGESDNVIKIEEAQKANDFLKEKVLKDLTYKTYSMPHSISGDELNDLRSWLSKAIIPF
ncbi:alpha/beta hydrolase [Aurantibacillus circumpalustris]|uniref:alpha/beta hydrolase n=1 Tax=Aurantibacillus circumpalustris TaxID=3036359 RepID=UPI00295C00B7|nr:dienelactone hydrolase family protein [Aurantibacillus circumpalustris]